MKIHFSTNEFNSKLFSIRVAEVVLTPEMCVDVEIGEKIYSQALASEIDLVVIRAALRINEPRFCQFVGGLETWTALPASAVSRLAKVPSKFKTRNLQPNDWPAIKGLLEFSSTTRFSADAHLSKESVQFHKLEMLKTHLAKSTNNGCVAVDAENRLIGFHVGYMKDSVWNLYELLVAPQFRMGFVSLQLVKHLMSSATQASPPLELRTSIYSHNQESKRFFNQLGFVKTGSDVIFYHLWPKQHQKSPR